MSIEHRLNHIAGQLSGNGDVLLNSVDARTGEPLPYAFHQATGRATTTLATGSGAAASASRFRTMTQRQ